MKQRKQSSKPKNNADFKNVIVKKPWGHEYLMYENKDVAVWCLHIKHGAKTSLHCHPDKKTGLILLSGEAQVSFMNGSTKLKTLDKLIIRPGLFHSTRAVSAHGVWTIELESLPIKTNLVRFDDEYGRIETPYEGISAMTPKDGSCAEIKIPKTGRSGACELCGCQLIAEKITNADALAKRPPQELLLVLEGGLVSKTGDRVLGPADVINVSTFNRLAKTFRLKKSISLLTIKKPPYANKS